MTRLLLILAALVLVTCCGGPVDECVVTAGGVAVCPFGPTCPRDTVWTDNGATDQNGFPIFSCVDGRGRQVLDCVVREDDVALGLCR